MLFLLLYLATRGICFWIFLFDYQESLLQNYFGQKTPYLMKPCFILILITMTGKEWQVPDLPFIDGEEAA